MPPSPMARNHGFTLLELIVVLFIIVLGFSVVSLNLSSGNESTKLKIAARDLVSALRFARGEALISHQEMSVIIDLEANTYSVSRRDKLYQIPKSIGVTVVAAKSQTKGTRLAGMRFFADGSSTGGRVILKQGNLSWQIDINWLTGQIDLNDKNAR